MLKDRLKQLKQRVTEKGFTLVEILVALAIVGVLAGVAYPVWTNIQNQQYEQAVKQKLSQAAVMLEQEAIDNNGYVPKYVPNEILADEMLREFTYEHKDRLQWCISARITPASLFPFQQPTTTLWFVSSENTVPSQSTACGGPGYEPMEGSSAPWDAPTIVAPSITTHTTSWPNTNNYASLASTVAPGSCTLSSTDTALFGPNTTLKFRVEIQNFATGRTATILTTPLSGSTSHNIASLVGFYPGDTYRIRAQSVCTVQTLNGYPYEYIGPWSAYLSGTTATFTVPAPTWTNVTFNVGQGGTEVPNRFNATWSSPYTCPTGSSKRYTIAVTYPGATSLTTQTVNSTTTSISNQQLAHNRPGFRHNFALRAICDYATSGVNINVQSPIVNREARSPMRPPAGTLSITPYTDPSNSVTITPSGFILNRGSGSQFTCATGTPVATMNARDSANVNYTARTVTFGAVADYNAEIMTRNTVGKDLTLTATVVCSGIVDGLNQTSANSTNTATGTHHIRYKIPPIPSPIASNAFSNNNNRLSWTATTCQYDGTPEYQVRQLQRSSLEVYAAGVRPNVGTVSTNFIDLTTPHILPGATTAFEVRVRCVNDVGASEWTGYTTGTGAKWTTAITAPSAPRSVSVTAAGLAKWTAPATSCQSETILQYMVVASGSRSNNSGWISGINTSRQIPGWVNAGGYSYTVKVSARCVGVDTSSAVSGEGTASITIPYRTGSIAHVGGCSNFRTGPGTDYGVLSCRSSGSVTITRTCSRGGYQWYKTSQYGWTISENLFHPGTHGIESSCTP